MPKRGVAFLPVSTPNYSIKPTAWMYAAVSEYDVPSITATKISWLYGAVMWPSPEAQVCVVVAALTAVSATSCTSALLPSLR